MVSFTMPTLLASYPHNEGEGGKRKRWCSNAGIDIRSELETASKKPRLSITSLMSDKVERTVTPPQGVPVWNLMTGRSSGVAAERTARSTITFNRLLIKFTESSDYIVELTEEDIEKRIWSSTLPASPRLTGHETAEFWVLFWDIIHCKPFLLAPNSSLPVS